MSIGAYMNLLIPEQYVYSEDPASLAWEGLRGIKMMH